MAKNVGVNALVDVVSKKLKRIKDLKQLFIFMEMQEN